MSKPRYRKGSMDQDSIYGDPEFSVDDFIDDMENKSDLRWRTSDRARPARRRLEDWLESRELRRQLDDWGEDDSD